MRFKGRKWASPFFIISLAIAGLFGVSAAVIDKQANETPVIEKAKADKVYTGHTIYWAASTSGSVSVAVCRSKNEGDWADENMVKTSSKCGSYDIYQATVYECYGGFDRIIFKINGSDTNDLGWTWRTTSEWEGKCCINNATSFTNVNTITYNPNGASGSTTTRLKVSGYSYTIANYSDVGISSHVYKHAVKWSTNTTGTGTDYQPNATYDANADLTLYFIETWYTYQFQVNSSGDWVTLTKTDDTPSGYVAKFSTTYSFTAGDTVSFRKYYGEEDPISITPSSYEENISPSGEIYYSAGGTYIDLKLTSGNGHTIKVGGFAERGIVVVRGGHNYKCPGTKTKGDDGHQDKEHEWTIYNITLLPGDTLMATYNGGTPYTIEVENTDVYGITTAGVVSTPGVYDIYLKSYDYNYNYPYVYLSMKDTESATLIAQTFNTALTGVCNSTSKGGDPSQITSAFIKQANYFNHLTSTCKDMIASDSTSDTDIVDMRAKYDYIMSHYNRTIAPDYLGRTNGNNSAIRTFTPFELLTNGEVDYTTIIIIVASSVSLLSITALSVLLVRKRKRNEQ